ncbi:MAG: acetylxylan esterase [Pirellulales bacterium]|nr:acetylxylan esterase [Pirellulales bacterium]
MSSRHFVGRFRVVVCLLVALAIAPWATADDAPRDTSRVDAALADYFRAETEKLSANCLAGVDTLDEWHSRRERLRQELFEMLSLDPLPERTSLQAATTGTVERDDFIVEKVHFQSLPGLYVTGNLYLPKQRAGKLPAILYLCGHGRVKKNGVSYGNKVHYQHHGAWFARHGYVCLTIDTLQLGELEGEHHGTYRHGRWWWNARGYTPAGVEAWNSIRALDYLQAREEVDGARIGATGRSGGGAYSWWIAALDDRIKVAAPVAGITDLENHVVDGAIEGHCDCMFVVNTYRWDYAQVAALVAPRPLLIENSDSDSIFPLDGVMRIYNQVRRIYSLYKASDKLGLVITPGPHSDTQDLQVPAFRWFNHWLKQDDTLITDAAVKFFEPEELKVFAELPADERNTKLDESFVPVAAEITMPADQATWEQSRDAWRETLLAKSFAGWPSEAGDLQLEKAFDVEREGVRFAAYDFTSQEHVRLRLYVAHRAGLEKADLMVLNVLDEEAWQTWLQTMRVTFAEQLEDEVPTGQAPAEFANVGQMFANSPWVMAYVAPRGIGPTAWSQEPKKQTHNPRRFMLLGQTLDGMRVWDVRRAIHALRSVEPFQATPLWLQSERAMAGVALYASLFEPDIVRLDLWMLPRSHQQGTNLLNVLKYFDMPQAVAMAAERSRVMIYQDDTSGWDFPRGVVEALKLPADQLQIRAVPPRRGVKKEEAAGK